MTPVHAAEPTTQDGPRARPGSTETDQPPLIDVRSAAFGYGDQAVVSGVSFEVRRHEVIAILGPNGAGKSTIVKGLLGLADHLAGEVELCGAPRARFTDHARVGYVPQRHTLSAAVPATVREIVATGRLPRLGWTGRMHAADRAIVESSLERVDLAARGGIDVSTLSGGQQRRVLIARALAGEPDVLLMDEPTAGVDATNQHLLAEVLGRLAAQGVTMLIVTHELAALEPIVTRILVVDGGTVSFDGSPAALAATPGALHDHGTHHHLADLADPHQRDPGDRPGAEAFGARGPLDQPATAHRHERELP